MLDVLVRQQQDWFECHSVHGDDAAPDANADADSAPDANADAAAAWFWMLFVSHVFTVLEPHFHIAICM